MLSLPCPLDGLLMTALIIFLGTAEAKEEGKVLDKHLHMTTEVLTCVNGHDWMLNESQIQRVR